MDSLFSHAGSAQEPAMPAAASVTETATIALSLDPREATIAFVEYLHLFWPQHAFSFSGEGAHVFWDATGAGEETEDGELLAWGTTAEWDLPERAVLEFTTEELAGSTLEVSIEAASDAATSIPATGSEQGSRLLITGPHSAAIPASLTDGEGAVWQRVAQSFARFTGSSPES